MNAEQQYEIIKKLEVLRNSRARVSFYTGNNSYPCLSVNKTGTGYQIMDKDVCRSMESCYQTRDYNTAIRVLNKIIKQAKTN